MERLGRCHQAGIMKEMPFQEKCVSQDEHHPDELDAPSSYGCVHVCVCVSFATEKPSLKDIIHFEYKPFCGIAWVYQRPKGRFNWIQLDQTIRMHCFVCCEGVLLVLTGLSNENVLCFCLPQKCLIMSWRSTYALYSRCIILHHFEKLRHGATTGNTEIEFR